MAHRDLDAARDAYYKLEDEKDKVALSKTAHSTGVIGKIVYTERGNGIVTDINRDGHYVVELHDSAETVTFNPDDVKLTIEATEQHGGEPSEVLKSFVFGGLDGIVTCFAIVATAYGAGLSPHAVFMLGISNLVADGFSMGLGDYFSAKSELEYSVAERRREMWEFENYPEGEQLEMVELYRKKGFSHGDASVIIKTMSKYPDFFVDHMMVEELGINPPDFSSSPAKSGVVMFLAFCFFGLIPIMSFAASLAFLPLSHQGCFIVSTIMTLVTLFVLGAAKGAFIRQSKIWAGLTMVLNGAIAVGLGFGCSLLLSSWLEDPESASANLASGDATKLLEGALNSFMRR